MEPGEHQGLGSSVPWVIFVPIELSTQPNIHVLQGLMEAVIIYRGKKTVLFVQPGTTALVVSHLHLALVTLDTTVPVVC
jgi:hypothetical protein